MSARGAAGACLASGAGERQSQSHRCLACANVPGTVVITPAGSLPRLTPQDHARSRAKLLHQAAAAASGRAAVLLPGESHNQAAREKGLARVCCNGVARGFRLLQFSSATPHTPATCGGTCLMRLQCGCTPCVHSPPSPPAPGWQRRMAPRVPDPGPAPASCQPGPMRSPSRRCPASLPW